MERGEGQEQARPQWTFLTNHAHIMVCIANEPDLRLRDIAERVGITERAAQDIVGQLETEGYLVRERVGRRNRYVLTVDKPLRHPLERHHRLSELLDLLADRESVR
ncbi:MAG: MarR family transcriptional regulator [Acidimicrobiales bacterium]|jgi:DNA-binding MarR family transcriptional regulator|nr:MarR family transcriptional regulator [Acidimicrobiales bacterium]